MSKLTVIKPYGDYIEVVKGGKGLNIDEGMPFEAFVEAVHVYGSIAADGLWALGDLFVFGERVYGESWAQAIEGMKYEEKTVANAAWVCNTFPPSRRHKELTFSHHHAVAGIQDIGIREEILNRAEKDELTVKQVTELKKEKCPKPPRKTKPKKDAPQSSEDAPETTEVEEAPQYTSPREITEEEGLQALDEAIIWLTQLKESGLPDGLSDVLGERLNGIRRNARALGYFGGQAGGKK